MTIVLHNDRDVVLPCEAYLSLASAMINKLPKNVAYPKHTRFSSSGERMKAQVYLLPPAHEMAKLRVDFKDKNAGLYVPSLNFPEHVFKTEANENYQQIQLFFESNGFKFYPCLGFSETPLVDPEFDMETKSYQTLEKILKDKEFKGV